MFEPLRRLPDGTIKQVSPFTGTQVWSLPGRGARPLGTPDRTMRPLDPALHDRHCAFCWGRTVETTPEIARVVHTAAGWQRHDGVGPESLTGSTTPNGTTPANVAFRLFPNLFEILGYDYWHLTHGFEPTPPSQARRAAYLASRPGRAHLASLARIRMKARGAAGCDADPMPSRDVDRESVALFAGNHLVIAARRHYVDGATDDSQLASSGTLSPDEHRQYVSFAVSAMRDLYRGNPHARYVSVFQNWLRPAGASFDHLHKQLVAIDELGAQLEREIARVRGEPDLYARWGPEFATEQNLVVARTPSAVAFVGVGHRYPSLEIHSHRTDRLPWQLSDDEVRDFADVLHACHAATGTHLPSNEEWHHRPPSVNLPMPLRAVLKWRISTPAGFEGATKIYVNTLDPWQVRNRVSHRLSELRSVGALSSRVQVVA